MANKKLDLESLRTRTTDASRGLSHADRERRQRAAAEALLQPAAQEAALPVERIQGRQAGDTRPLHPEHVVALAESIAVLGLIEAIAVDRQHRLLAGAHRLFAVRLLGTPSADVRLQLWQEQTHPESLARRPGGASRLEELRTRVRNLDPGSYARLFPQGVPVRVHDLDAEREPQRALQIEVAENEKRRDYTRDEVLRLVERLRPHGYVIKHGKLTEGEKPLLPELSRVLGKSIRQVQRLLDGTPTPTRTARAAPATPAPIPRTLDELVAVIDRSGLGRRHLAEYLHHSLSQRGLPPTTAARPVADVRREVLAMLREALDAAQDYLDAEGVSWARQLAAKCAALPPVE